MTSVHESYGTPYDPRYLQGIDYFNRGAFFDAHEVWEELWTDTEGPTRRFYQGLIQVAVCLHHFGNGNTRGARKLYHSSTDYLRAYCPRHAGLDVQRFLESSSSAVPTWWPVPNHFRGSSSIHGEFRASN